jgi:hypothetical protein
MNKKETVAALFSGRAQHAGFRRKGYRQQQRDKVAKALGERNGMCVGRMMENISERRGRRQEKIYKIYRRSRISIQAPQMWMRKIIFHKS